MATMKTLNGYGFNATEFDGKTASDYLLKTDTAADSAKLGGKSLAEIMLGLYPVGSIYMSVNSTSPASLFGGTWEQLQDRFLLAAGSTYSAGSTGGESSTNIREKNMPWGTIFDAATTSDGSAFGAPLIIVQSGAYYAKVLNRNNEGFNNMPPYLAVYMWKRVS